MQITKRDGRIVEFDRSKITNAICKAIQQVYGAVSVEHAKLAIAIATDIEEKALKGEIKSMSVEGIQDIVEDKLMENNETKEIAKEYIRYRQTRNLARENTIDKTIDEIVDGCNKYWADENSNKNHILETTKRDYIAGEVSIDKARRRLLPKEVVEAHDKGIIHFHDMDYFIQKISNCCLCNLEDMLENGTVISGTLIEKPKTFSTACNIATQIIAQVASSQYGGQSISIAHLSPFVESTRQKFTKMFSNLSSEDIEKLVANDIEKGVQILQYQVITLMTTNGQAPFITIYMNLSEVPEGSGRDDLAKVIEEIIKQRIRGVKNEKGIYVTPAFPKLIYALDDYNAYEGSKYYYLTELAAKCTAKRMVPDYISNKIERELKNGDTYTCMGLMISSI